ncbi:MAG TPA: nitroreductase/quinone reductase family protein [Acidimicrobiales bacterium]|nr:nitroreductase/quinone reductase family protein [Acidimicrobiales bacterium]
MSKTETKTETTTGDDQTRHRRRVIRFQRWVVNPPMKVMTWLGLKRGHVLVETTGRKTGRCRRNVVGARREGDTFWIVAEHGRHAGWVANAGAKPRVRVRHRLRWLEGRAEVVDGDDPLARLETFGMAGHARLVKKFGTDLATVRIDLTPQS